MNRRLLKLRQKLADNEVDALLISQRENRYYLSGFDSSDGFLLVSQDKSIFAIDYRYVEQLKATTPDFQVVQIAGDFSKWLPDLVSSLSINKLGFEANSLSFSTYQQLTEAIRTTDTPIEIVPIRRLVESLRAIKDRDELESIKKASSLVGTAFDYVITRIKPGLTEKEVALTMEYFLRENGSESIPFEIIVASGPSSAFPHAKPTERRIVSGEPVIIDCGARIDGYCSDMTRTICLGEADSVFAKVYDVVLKAQRAAISAVSIGMSGEQADQIARAVIEQADYGQSFGHSLGHGVGLAVHEEPRLGRDSIDILNDGMVFTIEPGIYLPGWGGVRIEDMVVLDNGKAEILTNASKTISGERDD